MRLGVMACAAMVALALAGQITVWALVHFTDVRMTRVEPEIAPESLRVVQSNPLPPAKPTAADLTASFLRSEINTVPGEADVLLRRLSAVTRSLGVLASILLGILVFQSVLLAGGSAVPGVERIVTAATLIFGVVLLCVPMSALVPDFPFRGVFVSYASLVEEASAYRAGLPEAPRPLAYFATHLLMPGAVLLTLLAAVARFRAGVGAGIIVTSVSELDEKLEREIRAMKMGEVAMPRAVGALNMAIGDSPADLSDSTRGIRAAPPAFRPLGERPMEPRTKGDTTKRPI